jgi:uncharacterized protein YrrD
MPLQLDPEPREGKGVAREQAQSTGRTKRQGMLQTVSELKRLSIRAVDGEIGHVRDAYFDDHTWTLRYIVVNPGSWLTGRWVQITPLSIRDIDWGARCVDVTLTRDQVRSSPDIDADPPVSRQHEIAYLDYYGYPYYWSGPELWGHVAFPGEVVTPDQVERLRQLQDEDRPQPKGDPHLRSANEVSGYHVQAVDASIGHVDDFLFDDRNWSLRYLVVDTRNWLPGRHVLVATDWVHRVSWEEHKAHVALTRDEVRDSPEYDRASFTQADEQALYQHYKRPPPSHVQH